MNKKILILSLSAGAGHTRAAESLREEAALHFPNAVVEHHDLIEFVGRPMKLVYRDFYHMVTKNAPLVWGYLYQKTNSPLARETIQSTSHLQALMAPRLARFLRAFKPDAIICTHFVCAEMISSLLNEKEYQPPIGVVITDYQIHHLWMVQGVRSYFVATDAMKTDLCALGIPESTICVSGIPVSSHIISATRQPHLYERFKLKEDRPTVLVLSGGWGLQDTSVVVQTLAESKLPLQICAVAGSNTVLKHKLKQCAIPPHITLRVFDFVKDIHNLYAISDVVISKAGGLTITECMARGLPLIVTDPLPGQEEANVAFVRAHHAALLAKTPKELLNKTHRILTNTASRDTLIRNMRTVARPQAAHRILTEMTR